MPDSFTLAFDGAMTLADAERSIHELHSLDLQSLWPAIDEAAEEELKFADCLPPGQIRKILAERLRDAEGMAAVLQARRCSRILGTD